MALPASDNTVLRRLKAKSGVEHPDLKVRVLGVDEWAWRKRQRYGTILMDLEKKQVIDLLPVRSVASLATWLGSHPEVEIITRDRSLLFADAGRRGSSTAVQITDRFHLVDNLVDAVANDVQQLQQHAKHDWAKGLRPSKPWIESRRLRCREARYQRYLAVVESRRQGQTIQAIATKLDLEYDTVSRFVRTPEFPERRIRGDRVRDERATGPIPPAHRNFSPPRVAVLLAQPAPKLSVTQRSYLDDFLKVCPVARELRRMVGQFRGMLRWRRGGRLTQWIDTARRSGFPFVASYAKTLLRDLRATELAITVPWSNGPIEGQINRLKTIKRQMYGRAGFELLKARVMPFEPLAA
jgi:transposase